MIYENGEQRNARMEEIRKEQAELFQKMGVVFYQSNPDEAQYPEIADELRQARLLDQEMETLEMEELKLLGLIICPECHAKVREDSRFCNFCGKKLAAANDSDHCCPHCGSVYEEGSRYCSICGGKLDDQKAEAAKEDIVIPEEVKTEEVKERICPNCGAKIGEGEKFCFQCGKRILM